MPNNHETLARVLEIASNPLERSVLRRKVRLLTRLKLEFKQDGDDLSRAAYLLIFFYLSTDPETAELILQYDFLSILTWQIQVQSDAILSTYDRNTAEYVARLSQTAVPNLKDFILVIDGSNAKYTCLCDHLKRKGYGRMILPVGLETLVALLRNDDLPLVESQILSRHRKEKDLSSNSKTIFELVLNELNYLATLDWKVATQLEKRQNVLKIIASKDYQIQLAIRSLATLSFTLSVREQFIQQGGLESLVLACNYQSNVLAHISTAQFNAKEINQVMKLRAKRQEEQNPIDFILFRLKMALKERKMAYRKAVRVYETSTAPLSERLKMARVLAHEESFHQQKRLMEANAAISRLEIQTLVEKTTEIQELIDSSEEKMMEGQELDGIHYFDWVCTIPTLEERRSVENQKKALKKLELDELKRLKRENVQMKANDKYSETEAERRWRKDLDKRIEEKRELELKVLREKNELKRIQSLIDEKRERNEMKCMSKQDTLYLFKLVAGTHSNTADFVEQAERIHMMRMRDAELKRLTYEHMTIEREDSASRQVRFMLQQAEQAQRVREEAERIEMTDQEDQMCRYLIELSAMEAKEQALQRKLERREQRKKQVVTTDQWIIQYDGEGNMYYENPRTGETAWEKPTDAPDWRERYDQEGNLYYENLTTGETSWTVY